MLFFNWCHTCITQHNWSLLDKIDLPDSVSTAYGFLPVLVSALMLLDKHYVGIFFFYFFFSLLSPSSSFFFYLFHNLSNKSMHDGFSAFNGRGRGSVWPVGDLCRWKLAVHRKSKRGKCIILIIVNIIEVWHFLVADSCFISNSPGKLEMNSWP